jgi:hypothetical protein
MAEAGQEEPELGLNTSKDGAGYLVAAHMVGMVGGTGGCRARHRLRFRAWVEKKIREMYTEIREMYTHKNDNNTQKTYNLYKTQENVCELGNKQIFCAQNPRTTDKHEAGNEFLPFFHVQSKKHS